MNYHEHDLPCDFTLYLSTRLGVAPDIAESTLGHYLMTFKPSRDFPISGRAAGVDAPDRPGRELAA